MAVPFTLLMALQVAQAGITGVVRDELSGDPLWGVVVALPDVGGRAVTDDQGSFRFPGLTPGPHHLTVLRQGYESRTLHALVPRGRHLELSIGLEPVPVELEGLTVTPRLSIRGVERDDPGLVVEPGMTLAAVRTHPMLPEADVFAAMNGGEIAVMPESPSGVHVRGGAAGQTAYELDGIPILAPYHSAGLFSAWNPDALGRVRLSTDPGPVTSLSGAVSGVTRTPGLTSHGVAALTTTHARMTLDGPLSGGLGYLVSVRSGFPSGVIAQSDPSKVQGESGDGLLKLEAPLLGGRVQLLGYQNEDELSSAVAVEPLSSGAPRNWFDWRSRSLGASWQGDLGPWRLGFRGWDASAAANVNMLGGPGGARDLTADRAERGIMATLEGGAVGRSSLLGVRVARSSSGYLTRSSDTPLVAPQSALASAALLLGHTRSLGARFQLQGELDLTTSSLGLHASPAATLSARVGSSLSVSGTVARRHQLFQPMRNEESLLGSVFPADLHVVAGAAGPPPARADEATLAFAHRPAPGLHVGARAYVRALESIVTVPTLEGAAFSMGGFDVGSASVSGVSVEGGLSGSRYGIVADYSWQRVRHRAGGRDFTPSYAPTHRAQAGVVLHPSATSALRVAATGAWGRRATALDGPFEWEACSLAENGCELAGTPLHGDALGADRLPFYLRLDLGAKKHWHVRLGPRDAALTLYGTLTNVLNRTNVLTYARHPVLAGVEPIEMLPIAPLLVGLEVAF